MTKLLAQSLPLAAVYLALPMLHAQTVPLGMTQVVASSITMGGVPIANGTVTILPVNALGNPIPFNAAGSLNGPVTYRGTITNGAIVGTLLVPDQCRAVATTPNTPAVFYNIEVISAATGQTYSLQFVGKYGNPVCGATWPLDAYHPTQTSSATAMLPSIYRGTWAGSTSYATNSIVAYNGSSYIALQPSAAAAPQTPASGSSYWGILAQVGEAGSPGQPGSAGPAGSGVDSTARSAAATAQDAATIAQESADTALTTATTAQVAAQAASQTAAAAITTATGAQAAAQAASQAAATAVTTASGAQTNAQAASQSAATATTTATNAQVASQTAAQNAATATTTATAAQTTAQAASQSASTALTAAQQAAALAATAAASTASIPVDTNGNRMVNGLSPVNIYQGLAIQGLHAFRADDLNQCQPSSGVGCNSLSLPFSRTYNFTRRNAGNIYIQSNTHTVNYLHGGENTNGHWITNINPEQTILNAFTPGQVGGFRSDVGLQTAMGDFVRNTWLWLGWGAQRGEDEHLENNRGIEAFFNANAGGTLQALTADPTGTGHYRATLSNVNGLTQAYYGEQNLVVDVSKSQPMPDVVTNTNVGAHGEFQQVTFATPHSLPVNISTYLTAAVDSRQYTGTCGAQTATGTTYPVATGPGITSNNNDAWVTNADGTGAQGINGNYDVSSGALVGFCATVASTAGMSDGQLINVAFLQFDQEYSRVIHVYDATHFTFFAHHDHDAGTSIAFGGATGYAFGMNADIRPPGFSSSLQNEQTAELRAVYPIVSVPDSTHIVLFTDNEQTQEMRTLGYGGNTISKPTTFTNLVVTGGTLTGFVQDAIGDPNDYVLSPCGLGGVCFTLPVPVLTFGGSHPCITNPRFTWLHSDNQNRQYYQATLADGGTGCPADLTITAAATIANPSYVVPAALIVSVIDPTFIDPVTGKLGKVGTGTITLSALNSSLWSIGDVVEQTMPSARYMNEYEREQGDPVAANGTLGGGGKFEFYSYVSNGRPYKTVVNATPSRWHIGTFENNWNPAPGNSYDASANVPGRQSYSGLWGSQVINLPTVRSTYDNTDIEPADNAPRIAGYLFELPCDALDAFSNADHPCAHNQFTGQGIFRFHYGPGGNLWVSGKDGRLVYTKDFEAFGQLKSQGYTGPLTAPSGPCASAGQWMFTQDGHASFCAAGTWVTKL